MFESTISLSGAPADLVQLREWLTHELAAWPSREVSGEVVLMASELVTNAIVHAASAPTVTLSVLGHYFRVTVHDDDPRPPVLNAGNEPHDTGNGLRLVNGWADEWGSASTASGKTVWFTVRRW